MSEEPKMSKQTFNAREHFRDVIPKSKTCVLCQGPLDSEEKERGIIEFMDGWFWICSKCRKIVGRTFDQTQCKSIAEGEIPPYYKRSRKYWLKWLEEEYQITIKQNSKGDGG